MSKGRSWRFKQKFPVEVDCSYCGRAMNISVAHVDHIIPKCRGGEDAEANMALSCDLCNMRKGASTPAGFLAKTKIRLDAALSEVEYLTDIIQTIKTGGFLDVVDAPNPHPHSVEVSNR